MKHRIQAGTLESTVSEIFSRMGVPQAQGVLAARGLVFADRRGIETHGVANLPIYVEGIRCGKIDVNARPAVTASGAVCSIAANRALGLWVAHEAMLHTIEAARRFGVGVTSVSGSTHCGAMGQYAMMAVEQGMIGVAMSNLGTQASAPAPGGDRLLFGTNPLSFAAPADEMHHFLLDTSTTAVSTGKIKMLHASGERAPVGWLVDRDGNDVTDPGRYLSGDAFLKLLGAPKSVGFPMMVDLLSALSGASMGYQGPSADRNIGHFFAAVDISRFRAVSHFTRDTDGLLRAVRASRGQDGQSLVYPGFPEGELAREDDVRLGERAWRTLCDICGDLGIPVSAPSTEDQA